MKWRYVYAGGEILTISGKKLFNEIVEICVIEYRCLNFMRKYILKIKFSVLFDL